MKKIIINAKIIHSGAIFENQAIIIENEKIKELISTEKINLSDFDEVIDARENYLSAGFIELHTHGIDGYDFMDNDKDEMLSALRRYTNFGVTSVFPTTMSCPFDELEETLLCFKETDFSKNEGACFLGAHLEGPYFSKEKCGAQSTAHLCPPSGGEYKRFVEQYPFIKRWDAAPELDGACEMAEFLTKKNIMCGIAHTNATTEQTLVAANAGYTIATHTYSAMSGVERINGYRVGGAVEGCFLDDRIFTEAICDGIHLPKELLQLIFKIKGENRMCLVTDSMRGAAMPEGDTCMLGNKNTGTKTIIANGIAWLEDKSAFAGSIATFDKLIRTVVKVAGIPLASAIKMSTETPARAMHVKNKGFLKAGHDADIVVFDENINIKLTMVGGKTVYTN